MNSNKQVAVYDNTVSARTYLGYIAEQAGGFSCIGRDGKLYIKTIGENTAELPLKYFQNFKWGDKLKISRVRYEDGIQLFENGTTTDNTVYINQDNMYIVDQEQIDNIYEKLNGLEVYGFEGDSIIDPAYDIGDILVIGGKKIIYQGSTQYAGKWKASISSKIQCKSKEETTTRTPSQKTINRRFQSSIDQANGKITQLANQTTEHEEKLTQVEQDVDSIRQKVSDTVDYQRNVEGVTEIHLKNAKKLNILKLEIEGNKKYEANLFPSEDLYPSSELYSNQEVL